MPAPEQFSGRPSRRGFLRGSLGASVAGATGVAGVAGVTGYAVHGGGTATGGPAGEAAGPLPAVPFHGIHQAGILPAPRRQAAVAAFTVTATGTAGLRELFRTLTDRARFLTAGGTPPVVDVDMPASDTGILGPVVVPDGLTVTVAVGASLFDARYGLAAVRPRTLTPMSTFPNDDLDPAQCGGDILIQLSAGDTDTVLHALRDITRAAGGAMSARWRIDGFTSPPRPAGTVPRNMLGFMDGIANPDAADPAEMNRLVWVQPRSPGEPAWTANGSYLVVRLIRMKAEAWDELQLAEQEHLIGRHRASGYPLGTSAIAAAPGYASDPQGVIIPLTAHIRLANPRTPQSAGSRILRRSYNYDRGLDADGNLDTGLVFTCYQRDLAGQFETVQRRLTDEPLSRFISPFGGGYFFALPGVTGGADYYGRALLDGKP